MWFVRLFYVNCSSTTVEYLIFLWMESKLEGSSFFINFWDVEFVEGYKLKKIITYNICMIYKTICNEMLLMFSNKLVIF